MVVGLQSGIDDIYISRFFYKRKPIRNVHHWASQLVTARGMGISSLSFSDLLPSQLTATDRRPCHNGSGPGSGIRLPRFRSQGEELFALLVPPFSHLQNEVNKNS